MCISISVIHRLFEYDCAQPLKLAENCIANWYTIS